MNERGRINSCEILCITIIYMNNFNAPPIYLWRNSTGHIDGFNYPIDYYILCVTLHDLNMSDSLLSELITSQDLEIVGKRQSSTVP